MFFLGREREKRKEEKNSLSTPLRVPPTNMHLTTVTGVVRRLECRTGQQHSTLCGRRTRHQKHPGGASSFLNLKLIYILKYQITPNPT
jgi:hypothetical protein